MKTIHKYQLTDNVIKMRLDAQVLTAQIQRGEICLWAMVNDEAPMEEREFRIIGTGHPVNESWRLIYIGTVQTSDGLVFHVFERLV